MLLNICEEFLILYRRQDKQITSSSRICSCHFKDGLKDNGPTMYRRNSKKVFQYADPEPPRKQAKKKSASSLDQSLSACCSYESPSSVALQVEVDILKSQVSKLESQLRNAPKAFSLDAIKDDSSLLQHYTGLPSLAVFDLLLQLCSRFDFSYYCGWNVSSISLQDQLFLTLLKLRCNFSHKDLGVRFSVCPSTISNVTITWINVLHEVLYAGFLKDKIPSVSKNRMCLPTCFSNFSNCRIILDCTEIQCEVPSNMESQSATFSHYKQRHTFKGLIGVAPNGVITYASGLYPGSTSDKAIVRHCGILNLMEPGDLIIADKGFLIQSILPPNVYLNLPPFLTNSQFTKSQAELTVRIARSRIHVERAIQRVKSYAVLNLIPHNYRCMATKLFQVVACLVNLQKPIIREVENEL